MEKLQIEITKTRKKTPSHAKTRLHRDKTKYKRERFGLLSK